MTFQPQNIAILGASGAIGSAFKRLLLEQYPQATLFAFSQTIEKNIDYQSEESIAQAADIATRERPLDLILVTNGLLHQDTLLPEKCLRELSAEKFQRIFAVNTITPALIAKHFLPKLHKKHTAIFAALSARVGSISDNRLGGWYAYRASKAALNMIIKNAAIEIRRSHQHAIVVGLHPGTVDSNLSAPFQANIVDDALFTPEFSANCLWRVLKTINIKDSGKCLAWDNKEILP